MPCTVLIYPALSPLVPGVMLYRAMLAFSKNNLNDGAIQIICVLAYAGCMAVAMTIASVLAKKVLTPLFAKYGKS
ncbi:MAG: threonine/serine exporter family protein, partial [Clostridia bacterium]